MQANFLKVTTADLTMFMWHPVLHFFYYTLRFIKVKIDITYNPRLSVSRNLTGPILMNPI